MDGSGYQSSAAVAAAEDNEERDNDDPDALVIEDVAKAVVHNIIPPVCRREYAAGQIP